MPQTMPDLDKSNSKFQFIRLLLGDLIISESGNLADNFSYFNRITLNCNANLLLIRKKEKRTIKGTPKNKRIWRCNK